MAHWWLTRRPWQRWALGLAGLALYLGVVGLALEGGHWLAMPPLLAAAAMAVASAAGVIGTVVFAGLTVGNLIMISSLVYGVVSAQSAARKAARNAKDAYNNSLTDRTTTIQGAEAPWQIIYGETVVGPVAMPAILTSGDKDQYKHVVVVWAAHECEAITDVLINGVSIGALDGNGYVTGGRWMKSSTSTLSATLTLNGAGAGVIPGDPPERAVSMSESGVESAAVLVESDLILVGHTVTVKPEHVAAWAGKTVRVGYDMNSAEPLLRVRHHLGTVDQLADALTMAEVPADWTASDRGRGLCYSIFRFDLNEPEFQGGPPQLRARIKGRKVYDHRTGLVAWSDNGVLCTADFLRAEFGKKAVFEQLQWAGFDASANVCDEALGDHGGARRFTCNGAFRTDQDTDATLNQLCASFAGFVTWTGAWYCQAGAFTEPVMELTDADNRGAVEILASPEGAQIFNGLRGKFYDPSRFDQPTDYPPYQNAGFVDEDGEPLWGDLPLPFTNSYWRCHNLGRIQVERSRGMQLVYPAKRRALRLRVGQRVWLTNAKLGMVRAIFRVVKREYKLGGAVNLTLAQDDPSYYDEVDAPAPLASPSSHLHDPFVVAPVAGLAATSGTATLFLQSDGGVLSRVRVAVTASTDALVRSTGALQVEWRDADGAQWQRAPEGAGTATELYLLGLQEGRVYLVRARWRNGIGALGDWRSTVVLHRGKSEPPAAVAGLTLAVVPGALKGTRTPSTEADYARTLYRYGASFASGTPVPGTSDASGFVWPAPPLGPVVIWAADVDSSGNIGPAVSAYANVDARALVEGGNLIDLSWWRRDAAIPWPLNGGEYNRIISVYPSDGADVNVAGPKGGNDLVWYAEEQAGNGDSGGGWHAVPISLDPTQTYRFVVPMRRHSGTAGSMWWGTGNIENLNGQVLDYSDYGLGLTSANPNPYFIGSQRPEHADRWYLAVGYIYPAGSTNNTHESAGLWDCKTGARVSAGFNYRFKAGDGHVIHRAYQFYASLGAKQLFGRPLVSLVDGTEPGLREYFEVGAVLNSALVPSIAAAQGAADAAQAAASAAAVNATAALGRLAIAESNSYYDRGEKPALIREWQAISDEQPKIYAEASGYGIVAERDSWYARYNGLASYLSSLAPSWADTSSDTPIVPAESNAAWSNYYDARATLRRRISEEAGKVAQWPGVAGRPKAFKVGANGLSVVSPPVGAALYNAETGAVLLDGAAMYRVAKIHRTTQAVTDVGGWNTLAGGGNPAAMAAALNAIGSDHIVVVYSHDEPQGNRLTDGLLEAMLRHGASRAVFGSPAFRYRAAYILVAIGGCGEGNGAECYAGEVNADPNAWCELGFQLHNGVLTVSGTTSGARSLTDYGYVGDLNATLNEVIYSPTAPAYPTERMTWIDTSVTPRTIKVRVGGVWQLAGTYVNGTAQITDDANLGLTALWAGVAGSGKPADNATRNQVYFQDTDPVSSPGGVVDGAIWISSTKARQRVSGAWQPYVGAGSVGTGELADQAAVKVVNYVDAVGIIYSNLG